MTSRATETMHAARVTAHGGFEAVQWTEVPRPTPGTGEVLVAIEASGMNHLDLWVRRGVPGHRFPLPLTLGSDGFGVVLQRGPDGAGPEEGTPVIIAPGYASLISRETLAGCDHLAQDYCILGETTQGTCAEYIVIPASNAIPCPDHIASDEAACFALSALTAWTMLVRRAELSTGETVLVLAGGSGIGSMAIQIAKLFHCRVIATAGGDAKCKRVQELGADEVIDHNESDIASAVRSITNKRGVDVVVEHVGEATWSSSLRSLARGGRLVTCGATTGPRADLDLRPVFFKNLSILGSTMGAKADVYALVDLLASRRLKPVVGATLSMKDVRSAHELLESREVFGKVVLTRS